jgi:hypothetical protein
VPDRSITESSANTSSPQSLSIDIEKWHAEFGGYDDYTHKSGVYFFLWNGEESELPSDTEHWVKGKQKGDSDPNPLPAGVRHMKSITLKGKPSEKYYVHYEGRWIFKSIQLSEGRYISLYVGKSTNVVNRIQQHLYWPATYAAKYTKELNKHLQRGFFRVPRYNTASQFSDHFHFMFRNYKTDKGVRDFGHSLKVENISIAVSFAGFADYADRFFNEDHLIGEFRPPFNLDSER